MLNEGITLYPDMSITIDAIKVDGKDIEFTKNYTSSDN